MTRSSPGHGTILIADDNRVNRLLLARGLEHDGHSVVFAEHGAEALELLRQQPFDLMLLDVLMPELDGYEVLAKLKDDPHLREIPVIVTSALDVFAADLSQHLFRGNCGRPARGVLPLPAAHGETQLAVDWTRCEGHGLCARLVPELVQLERVPVTPGAPELAPVDDVATLPRANADAA